MQLKRISISVCLLASIAHKVEAQSSRRQLPSTVEGDVFLLMKNGDTKKGAGLTIYLRQQTDYLIRDLRAICTAYQTSRNDVNPLLGRLLKMRPLMPVLGDSDATWRVERMIDSIKAERHAQKPTAALKIRAQITAASGVETGTGMNAHYRFSRVPAGKYFLFGEWTIGDTTYQWWAPIEVSPGITLRKDLDNSAEADGLASCDDVR